MYVIHLTSLLLCHGYGAILEAGYFDPEALWRLCPICYLSRVCQIVKSWSLACGNNGNLPRSCAFVYFSWYAMQNLIPTLHLSLQPESVVGGVVLMFGSVKGISIWRVLCWSCQCKLCDESQWLQDLQHGPGLWRRLPGLFISVRVCETSLCCASVFSRILWLFL